MKRYAPQPGAELAQADIDGHDGGNLSEFIWPTYKRLTAAAGGDVSASFQFGRDNTTMETWFYTYLGRRFTESYQGQQTFLGRIHTMRLAYNRLVLTISLDWLFNSVACQYTSILDGSTLMTSFFEDADSIATYGRRQYIVQPTDKIGLSEAQAEAQRFLATFKQPKVSRGKLDRKLVKGQLKVTVQGLSQTLDAEFHNESTEGQDGASIEVANALSGASLIVPGTIETNSTQVDIQADYQPRLKRIEQIARRRDAQGRRYNYGAVGSNVFNYRPVTPFSESGARYRLWVKRPFLVHFDASNNHVPAPLVMPGGYSEVTDMKMPPSPFDADSEDSPLVQFDASVEYSIEGALLRGGAWGPRERAESIQMALIAQREQ